MAKKPPVKKTAVKKNKIKKTPISNLLTKIKTNLADPEHTPDAVQPESSELKLLFLIVDWNQANIVSDILVEEHVRFHFLSKGIRAANSELLDLLGIGIGEKAVVFCLEEASHIPVLIKDVRKVLRFTSSGAGIAFTIPLSAINDPILLFFKQEIRVNARVHSKGKGEEMEKEFTHDLVMAIVNQGYSDELVNTAREAGASGGTVITARGQAHEGAVKFFGISVQDEKELILILANREKKVDIMRAISEAHGLNSKAHGIVFSLPVDDVVGMSFE